MGRSHYLIIETITYEQVDYSEDAILVLDGLDFETQLCMLTSLQAEQKHRQFELLLSS